MTIYHFDDCPYYLDTDDRCYAPGTPESCGGCDMCQLLQAEHYGHTGHRVYWVRIRKEDGVKESARELIKKHG